MKKTLLTMIIVTGLGILPSMAQEPDQHKESPPPSDQRQQAPSAKPALPSIREQGEAVSKEQKGRQVDEKPGAAIPKIREQEGEPRPPERKDSLAAETPSSLLDRPYKGSELNGREIKGQNGEELGTIADTIIGRGGRVEFVLVSYGGILGIRARIVAVPYSALRQGAQQDSFVVGFNKEKMEQAPSFQEGQWPDFYTEAWTREVRSYYGE